MAAFDREVARAHLRGLGRRHLIGIRWRNGPKWHERALAEQHPLRVTIPVPYNMRQYLVGLHEFGHLLGVVPITADAPDDWSPVTRTVLGEAAAWAWALEHILDSIAIDQGIELFEKTVGKGMTSHCFSAWVAHDN